MSGKLAYRLAVIMMISPLVIIPSFIAYRIHEYHVVKAQYEARAAEMRAEMQARIAQSDADKHQPYKP